MSVCYRTSSNYSKLYLRAYGGTLPEGYTRVNSGQPQWFTDNKIITYATEIVFEPDGGTIDLGQVLTSIHYCGFSGMKKLQTFSGDENVDLSNCTLRSFFENCPKLVRGLSLSTADGTIMKNTFKGCTSLQFAPAIPSTITDMESCFEGCRNLRALITIPTGVTSLQRCFAECNTVPAEIPSTVTNMQECFLNNGHLNRKYPAIPASVTNMTRCFYGAYFSYNYSSIEVYNVPTSYEDIFTDITNKAFIINKGSGAVEWREIASNYSNAHYEADDNPVPSLTFSVTRVGAMNSTTPVENGEYAYVKATAKLYKYPIPYGWSVSFGTETLKIDGVTQSPLWTETQDGNTYTLECWRPLGDTARHTFTMQVNDAIEDAGDTVMASHDSLLVTQILPKAYKLVDYFHDDVTDTEGMSVGKFADVANLFDVDMPSRFRDSVIVDKLIGEIKMFAGENIPTGWHLCDGSELAKADYPLLYNAIGDAWGTPVDSDNFVLPNLMGRVPVGCDENDTDFDTVGNNGGTKDAIVPYHNHTQSAHSHATSPQLYRVENRFGSGSRNAAGTYSGYGAAVNTNSQQPAIQYAGTEGNTVGANLQPYAVVNYIICWSV